MKTFNFGLLLMLSFTIVSCFSTTNLTKSIPSSSKIEKNKVIYIAPIDDGAFGGKAYYGSGKSVANYFLQYFRSDASDVIVGAEDTVNADYIVKAVITHWEPRAAAWSGIPTRVEILVSVYNANSKEKIIDDKLSVTGRSFTFVNQSAEGLAEYLIKEFCNENIRK